MDEVLLQLIRSTPAGKRDRSYSRLAPFEDVWANNAVLGDNTVEINMDKLAMNLPVNRFEYFESLKSALERKAR